MEGLVRDGFRVGFAARGNGEKLVVTGVFGQVANALLPTQNARRLTVCRCRVRLHVDGWAVAMSTSARVAGTPQRPDFDLDSASSVAFRLEHDCDHRRSRGFDFATRFTH